MILKMLSFSSFETTKQNVKFWICGVTKLKLFPSHDAEAKAKALRFRNHEAEAEAEALASNAWPHVWPHVRQTEHGLMDIVKFLRSEHVERRQ